MLESLLRRADQGVSQGALPFSPVEYCILAAGSVIAWAYTIELVILVFYTFKRRKGLYFWSLLISSWGSTLHALGFILKFLAGVSWLAYLPFVEIGWVTMVTGQAFVLYSRLFLVVRNQRTIRLLLWMIIIDAVILHIPTIIFTYGSNSPNAVSWTPKFNVMERIQLVGFCLQEFVISTVYIVATVKLLASIYHSRTRKVMVQLLVINFICIGMDVVLICLEFTNNYIGEASIKPMIYAIKLKLEFAVLNQLMGLAKAGFTEENNHNWRPAEGPDSHELKNRTLASSTHGGDTFPNPTRAPPWTPTRLFGRSLSNARTSVAHPEQIFKTQHVDVVSESVEGVDLSASASTAVTAGDLANVTAPAKVKSLMGTHVVKLPERPTRRHSRRDPSGRRQSPSESEMEIIRASEDSDKPGTRWIGGHD